MNFIADNMAQVLLSPSLVRVAKLTTVSIKSGPISSKSLIDMWLSYLYEYKVSARPFINSDHIKILILEISDFSDFSLCWCKILSGDYEIKIINKKMLQQKSSLIARELGPKVEHPPHLSPRLHFSDTLGCPKHYLGWYHCKIWDALP